MDFVEKKNTYRARKTILEMLEDRKYIVPDAHKLVSFSEFIQMFDTDNYDIHIKGKNNDANAEIYVKFYTDSKKLTIKDLQNIVQDIRGSTGNELLNIIVISKDRPSQNINKELKLQQYNNVELFVTKDIMINIMKHDMMPIFRELNAEEIDAVTKKYSCSVSKFPKLFKTDPAAKYYNMKPGDVYEIERTSGSTGKYYSYRLVK
jgi:DNA-directed RNA polymerase I, II, and III subunit RPABC1